MDHVASESSKLVWALTPLYAASGNTTDLAATMLKANVSSVNITPSGTFSVKFTGGPNGDVAGNAMRILLDRCPKAAIRLILDGTGALCARQGPKLGERQLSLMKSTGPTGAP